ncbi:MAG: GNAT family N-acetyltransferase [Bacteriovoracia bacterium]
MQVREIPTEATFDLRHRVLRPSQPISECQYPADGQAVHFGVFEEERLCSVVTAHPENSPLFPCEGQWRIRGMATEPGAQGRGLGSLGLKALLAWAEAHRVSFFWCNAREGAIPFYLRHGFTVASELFDLPGIGPHKVMFRQVDA